MTSADNEKDSLIGFIKNLLFKRIKTVAELININALKILDYHINYHDIDFNNIDLLNSIYYMIEKCLVVAYECFENIKYIVLTYETEQNNYIIRYADDTNKITNVMESLCPKYNDHIYKNIDQDKIIRLTDIYDKLHKLENEAEIKYNKYINMIDNQRDFFNTNISYIYDFVNKIIVTITEYKNYYEYMYYHENMELNERIKIQWRYERYKNFISKFQVLLDLLTQLKDEDKSDVTKLRNMFLKLHNFKLSKYDIFSYISKLLNQTI